MSFRPALEAAFDGGFDGGSGGPALAEFDTLHDNHVRDDEIERIGGTDRYDTARLVAEYGFGHGLDYKTAFVATGQNFADALTKAGDWLTSDAAVPARPLQDPSEWPAGATIVLNDRPKKDEGQAVCRYCDYQLICGIKEIR